MAEATGLPAQSTTVGRTTEVTAFASADGLYPAWMNHSVAPRSDFFSFANGGWIKANPIPADRAYWGVDTQLEQENAEFILHLLETLPTSEPAPVGTPRRKIADFYFSGMDEPALDAAGATPLAAEFARIEGVSNLDQLQNEFAHLQMIGVSAPLAFGQMQDFSDSTRVIAVAMQGGLGLPNRDYYLKDEPSFAAIRREYVLHVARMFVLLGQSPSEAEVGASKVMALETRLAEASLSDVEQRDPRTIYHPMTVQRVQALTPHLHWATLLGGMGHPELQSLNVGMPTFFKRLDRELTAVPISEWRSYLRWQLIDEYGAYLSKAFTDEGFRMRAVLTGAKRQLPRWVRVLRAEDEILGFAVGELYVAQKFPPLAKQAATTLVDRIRDALRMDLSTLSWMSPATRKAAIDKLDLMELRVGYPEQARNYAALAIDRGPYVLNVMRGREFEQRRELDKIGKPVDRAEWLMTPQTVNAYYDASMNSLTIPAAILQPPYFDASWPDAVNYGAAGATVGHEMTHGFDDEGAKFDGHGNLKDWWAPSDLKKFRAATRCIADQYSHYPIAGGLHIQGDLVTGEATADLGGLILAWRALHMIPDHKASSGEPSGWSTDQQFFLAFAHSWASQMRPEQLQETITTDPHPPPDARANGSLANDAEFQAAFAIIAPSPMIKASRCLIW